MFIDHLPTEHFVSGRSAYFSKYRPTSPQLPVNFASQLWEEPVWGGEKGHPCQYYLQISFCGVRVTLTITEMDGFPLYLRMWRFFQVYLQFPPTLTIFFFFLLDGEPSPEALS